MTDGGPAFPQNEYSDLSGWNRGMSLRDYFAAHMQADDRLVKCVRAMDDEALNLFGTNAEMFARYPDMERDEWITETAQGLTPCDLSGLTEVQKIYKRLVLEARAIAVVRYMQADAMLEARAAKGGADGRPL